ncbi:MAG: ATP-binding protein [Vulcanisaeta sp.]
MLFDLEPKSTKVDLFDFEMELNSVINGITNERIIVIRGLRRTGKTSLMRVALNESGYPYIYLDPRFPTRPTQSDFAKLLERGIRNLLKSSGSLIDRIKEALSEIDWVRFTIAPLSVELKPNKMRRIGITELLDSINDLGSELGMPIVIAIDEAQELSKITWINFNALLAYAYDNLKYVRFLLTGSEVGVLDRFLKIRDPQAPLFGRYIRFINTRRLSPDESMEFLKRGFEQYGIKPNEELLMLIVNELDGVIGWLTYIGHQLAVEGKRSLDEVLESAIELALGELRNFLTGRSARYRILIKQLTVKRNWRELKSLIESAEGKALNDKSLYVLLKELMDHGIVEKVNNEYVLSDPILRRAALRL